MRYWWVTVLALLADRGTKILAERYLMGRPGGTLPIIDGVIHLTYVENTGMAFGLLPDMRWLFVLLTGVVIVLLAAYIVRRGKRLPDLQAFTLCLILGGAAGNFIDRLWRGYVVDFVDFRLINFAVFNVSDMCLVIGILMLMLELIMAPEPGGEPDANHREG